MCAVRGTKLYGLRIKKKSQIINDCKENIFKDFILTLKKICINFAQRLYSLKTFSGLPVSFINLIYLHIFLKSQPSFDVEFLVDILYKNQKIYLTNMYGLRYSNIRIKDQQLNLNMGKIVTNKNLIGYLFIKI